MNTVKHFVKISQILQILKRIHHFVSNFGFTGFMTLHLKPRFWLAE